MNFFFSGMVIGVVGTLVWMVVWGYVISRRGDSHIPTGNPGTGGGSMLTPAIEQEFARRSAIDFEREYLGVPPSPDPALHAHFVQLAIDRAAAAYEGLITVDWITSQRQLFERWDLRQLVEYVRGGGSLTLLSNELVVQMAAQSGASIEAVMRDMQRLGMAIAGTSEATENVSEAFASMGRLRLNAREAGLRGDERELAREAAAAALARHQERTSPRLPANSRPAPMPACKPPPSCQTADPLRRKMIID